MKLRPSPNGRTELCAANWAPGPASLQWHCAQHPLPLSTTAATAHDARPLRVGYWVGNECTAIRRRVAHCNGIAFEQETTTAATSPAPLQLQLGTECKPESMLLTSESLSRALVLHCAARCPHRSAMAHPRRLRSSAPPEGRTEDATTPTCAPTGKAPGTSSNSLSAPPVQIGLR